MSGEAALAAIAKSAGKKPTQDLEVTGVGNIKPSDIGKAVRVKVYRKWTVTSNRGGRQATLSFILLDQQGGAIQANAEGKERIRFDHTLHVNGTYTITGFGLLDTRKWMQTLPNNFTLILGRLTDVQPFNRTGFPEHHFNFAHYTEVGLRADRNDVILTDYIGCVLYVGDIQEPKNPGQRPVIWRDIMLKNLEGDTLRFTLWNEKARGFNIEEYEKEPKPAVMAVSSCWVKTYGGLQLSASPATCYYFNPMIPETDYILSMYSQLIPPPVIQNVRTSRYNNIEQEKTRNRVTVDELLREDPRNQTNIRFTVVATVVEVIVGRPWYFLQCHDCRRKILTDRPHVYCAPLPAGESEHYSYCFRMLISDNTGTLTLACFSDESHSMVTECNKVVLEQGQPDPYTLPSVLVALEGTTYLFQLHFSTESTKENPLYVLDTVMETGPHLLAEPLENAPTSVTVTEPDEEILSLTGPQTSTQHTRSSRPADTLHASGIPESQEHPAESVESDMLQSPIKPEQTGFPAQSPVTAEDLSFTPPTAEVLQRSNPATADGTSGLHKRETKSQGARTSIRRQLLKNDPSEEASMPAKKTKQGN